METVNNDSIFLHAFNLYPAFGPKRLLKIGEFFGSFKKAFLSSENELAMSGIELQHCSGWIKFKQTIDLDKEVKTLVREEIQLLNYKDPSYPSLLAEISSMPPLLYYKGSLLSNDILCLAVVGTRQVTDYGRLSAPRILEPLVRAGITIVSGLAYGIDFLAHKVAVDNNSKTIAVLGCGLDSNTIYPKDHLSLAQKILEKGGMLISEYPPTVPAFKQHFIARNRIISGLSIGTLVIECKSKSGALITAQYALDQNRTVYAVPGPIYSENSDGPNNLIKMGARAVTESGDILNDLNLAPKKEIQVKEIANISPTENQVLTILTFEPKHINEIVKASALDAAAITAALTFLELKGYARNLGAQQYVKAL